MKVIVFLRNFQYYWSTFNTTNTRSIISLISNSRFRLHYYMFAFKRCATCSVMRWYHRKWPSEWTSNGSRWSALQDPENRNGARLGKPRNRAERRSRDGHERRRLFHRKPLFGDSPILCLFRWFRTTVHAVSNGAASFEIVFKFTRIRRGHVSGHRWWYMTRCNFRTTEHSATNIWNLKISCWILTLTTNSLLRDNSLPLNNTVRFVLL